MSEVISVLHVDDDPAFGDLAATCLEGEDDRLAVETVTSVAAGVDRLDSGEFECVVSDYEMPGQNGIEFLESIREEYPDLPFILHTGKGSEEVAADAVSAGVTDYLQKETGSSQYTVLANRINNAVEQYRSQKAVEETKRKLSEITNKTDDVLFMFDGEWRETLFANSSYNDLFGGSVEELEANPRSFLNHIPPDDRDRVRRSMERLSNGEPDDVEFRVRRQDSDHRWLRGESKPIFDDGETVSRIVGFIRDITAQKTREQELEETNALLSTLVEALPVGILAEDESRHVLAVNERLLELFDLSVEPEGAVGLDCERMATDVSEMFVAPERFVQRIDETIKRAESVRDEELELRDSRTFTRAYEPLSLPDGSGHLWIYRDVTDRAEFERKVTALHDAAQDIFQAKTRDGVSGTTVEAMRDILGMPVNGVAVHETTENVLRITTRTDRSYELIGEDPVFHPGESLAWEAFKTGETKHYDDVSEVPGRHNPETAIRSEIIIPLGDHGVLLIGSTETGMFDEVDISLAETLATHTEAALDRVAHERELERQNQQLDQFASVVSHDLRNPLSVAQARLTLAQDDCGSTHLDSVEDALDRTQTLIDDLLALARDGKQVTDFEDLSLATLAETCWDNVVTDGATLDSTSSRRIIGDRSRLQQLFENLYRNAVTHCDGDVTVTVGTLTNGFYVEDDGPGIPPDERAAVFDAGYSTDRTGTGFGLAIVEQIVNAHDWDIRITDGTDGGTRFEITGVSFAG